MHAILSRQPIARENAVSPTGQAPLQLRGSQLRTILENGAIPLDQLYSRLGLQAEEGWLADVLDGRRDATRVELARLAAYTQVPLAVLSGVVRPEQSMAVALRAGLLDSPTAVEPVLQRTRRLLEHFRLLASWYPHEVDQRLDYGEKMFRARVDDTYIKRSSQRTAQYLRALLKLEHTQPVGDLREIIESLGVPVFFTELPENIHGVTAHEDLDQRWRALILVNSNDNWTRQRYTLAHELGHVIFRDSQPVIVDDNEEVDETNLVEFRAECFARYFLAPNEAVDKFKVANLSNTAIDKAVAQTMLHFGISRPAAVRALAESFNQPHEFLESSLPSGSVRALMTTCGYSNEWKAASAGQHDQGASPWLLELALAAYQDSYVSTQVVADILGRSDEIDAVEAELITQGWKA